ncbi:MAG TPA: MATE family efflux transporter [Anaeromyxobacteraceae bacterium]|nr:MATE family efflux transporter [Anaeromyxobacteraceae bacterium]
MEARHPPLRRELSALLRLALPLAVAQGGLALMGVVDSAVLGRAGPVPLAGTGLGNALFLALSVFGIGVMMGLDPLVAQAAGAGQPVRARRLLWQGVWLSLGVSAAVAVPTLAVPPLLVPLGIEPDVAAEAGRYLVWRLPGLPFALLYVSTRAYLQAGGHVRPIAISALAANAVNVPADLLLVFGGASLPAWTGPLRAVPAMGAAGAAIATSLCMALQAAVLARSAGAVPLGRPAAGLRAPDRAELRAAVRVGVPVGLHMGAEVGIFALVGFLAGRLGAVPLAAHQIAIAVATLTFTVAVGVGAGGAVRVGWAVGARDREGARRSGLVAFGAGAAFMSLCALAFLAVPGPIARLLTDDPGVVAAAVPLLRVAALFQVSDGIQAVGAGVLRGAGETRYTFAANMVGHWALGVPAAVLLGIVLGGGVTGLWWGFCIGLTVVAVSLLRRFLRISTGEIVPLSERARLAG